MLEDNHMDTEENFEESSAKRKHDELTGLVDQDSETSKTPAVAAGTPWHYDLSDSNSIRVSSKLPLARVRRILKEDKDFQGATGDASALVSKATVISLCTPK